MQARLFRKKPLEVQAVRVTALLRARSLGEPYPNWVRDAENAGDLVFNQGGVYIRSLEGDVFGGGLDWIIRGVKGELYPCKADIFEMTYEPVEDGGAA